MPTFFTTNQNAGPVLTIGDTNLPQYVTGVNISMAWIEVEPAIRQAKRQYMEAFMGKPMIDEFEAMTSPDATQEAALEMLRDALANYAIYHILPTKMSVLTSAGVVQNNPQGGAVPSSQWGYVEKRLSALATADAALDSLMAYMDADLKAGNTTFDTWATHQAYMYKKSAFFRNTSDLDEYLNIKQSFRSFISIVPYIARIEQSAISSTLCTTLYSALLGGNITTANQKLIPYVREAAAYLGAAEALPHHRVVVDGDGFRIVSQTDGFTDRRNLTNSIHEQAIGVLRDTYLTRGQKALNDLRVFLESNLDDYPDYRDSQCREITGEKDVNTMYASPDNIGAVGIL